MPPKIVLVRHAQGSYYIADPPLTDLGIQQCAELRKSLLERFSSVQNVAIISSPMRRTLQTALHSVDWLIERGVKIQADADWQENSDKPCDTGSPISSLTAEFPPNLVDFSSVDPLWPDKTSPAARPLYGFTRSAILERGRRCLEKLYQRPEELVIVFSHSAFLRLGVTGWWYVNADYRIFEFGDESEEAAAVKGDRRILKHDWETLAGGLGLSWTHTTELGLDLPEDGEKPAGDDNE